jgi:uncharacterized damage-inducible protein DinB
MANPLIANAVRILEFARRNTLAFLEEIPEDKWCYQPFEGANHVAWILGHLAQSDNYFVTQLADRPNVMPPAWDELFGMGSRPTSDRARYPAPSELRDILRARREELITWVRGLPEKKLEAPLPEDWHPFAPTYGSLPDAIAWHEGLHAGQLTAIRKSLGIGPKYG